MPLPPPIPAESGLSGAPMLGADMTANANMADQPEEPTVAGPAVTKVEPEPHESVARHIIDALGGSNKGDPMGWAKSVIAGGLAGAANVGEVHGGQGFLAGAGRAQQGIAAQKRQTALDQQRQQQQQFENQEKLKADARAEQELANTTDRTKAEIALHNANTLAAIHSDQRAQALAPFMEAEQKAKLTQLQTAQDESRVNLKKVLIESGMSPKDAEESITSYENAPSGAAKDIASGSMLLTHNGETAKQEEDGVGVHASPNAQSLWDSKIKKDTQVLSGFQYDDKKGFVPQYTTVSAGTSVGTIVAMHDAAHDYLQQQQAQLTQVAEAKMKKAQLEHEQASTEHEQAETKLAIANAGLADQKPMFAFNTQTGEREQITQGDIKANPRLYTNPVSVKEGDIEKQQEASNQLGDAQMNLTRAKLAYDKYDELGMSDKRAVAAITGEDRFKAEFMGAEVPVDWANKLLTNENFKMLSPEARDAVVGYLGLRSAVIAYQKAVTKSGRSTDKTLQIEEAMLPPPGADKLTRKAMLDRFQQNVDQVGKGIPKMPGTERPQEIRQRLEAENAKNHGATHMYDTQTKTVKPISWWDRMRTEAKAHEAGQQ